MGERPGIYSPGDGNHTPPRPHERLPQPDGPSMDLLHAETDSILGHGRWFARLRARIFGSANSGVSGRTGRAV